MTNREFYTNIANGVITDVEKEFAANAITKLDEANAKRKEKAASKPSKTAEANAPIIAAITGILTSEVQTASTIAEAVGISVNKASALLRQIVASGVAVSTDVKVPGKGSVKGYALAE